VISYEYRKGKERKNFQYESYLEKLRDTSKHMMTLSISFIAIILVIANVLATTFTVLYEPATFLIIVTLIVGILPTTIIIISIILSNKLIQPSDIMDFENLDKQLESLETKYKKHKDRYDTTKWLFFIGIISCIIYITLFGVLMQF
jgi:magnesium-transporting ATPase (P-type)